MIKIEKIMNDINLAIILLIKTKDILARIIKNHKIMKYRNVPKENENKTNENKKIFTKYFLPNNKLSLKGFLDLNIKKSKKNTKGTKAIEIGKIRTNAGVNMKNAMKLTTNKIKYRKYKKDP